MGLLGLAGGLREFFAKGGEEGGPPGLGLLGGAGAGCRGLYHRCEGGEGGGEPLVELVGGGGLRGGWDLPCPEPVGQVWPVGVLLARSGFVVMGEWRVQGN